MKKLLSLTLAFVLLLSSVAFAAAANYVGEWILTDIESDGVHYNPEQQNASMSMTLRADGTALLERKGYSGEGTWEETSTGVTIYDDNGNPTKFKMQSGKLAYVSGADVVRTFTRKCSAADFVGVWVLKTVGYEGETYTPEELTLDMTMTINADGSAKMHSSQVGSEDGTWAIQNLDNVVYQGVGAPMIFAWVGGKLVTTTEVGLTFTLVRGSASASVPGDADGDSGVSLADAIAILDYCAGGASINETNADVNADGAVDLRDVLLILQYLAGWNVTLK